MSAEKILKGYAERVGYSDKDIDIFKKGGHRIRQVTHLFKAAPLYTIEASVIESENCNSGHQVGDKLILDVDGNFISKLCPQRMCVYLLSQLTVPVALINERLSEGLEPNDFHFMRKIRCPDMGLHCLGYGEVAMEIAVKPRQ